MQVIMQCGGLGTRSRKETGFCLKPMATIGARPMLSFGGKGDMIIAFIRN